MSTELSDASDSAVLKGLPARLSNPARSNQMLEVMEQVFANGAPDPETAGPLLAQLDMEMLAPTAS